jgi:glycosyltransferase involved in cell wall biosynthesis
MKVLFFSPVPTDPPNAGNRVRISTLAGTLQQAGHEVHFAYLGMEPADLETMAKRFGTQRLHVLTPAANQSELVRFVSHWVRRFGRLSRVESAYVWKLDDWYHDSYTDALRQLHATHDFDAVFVEYVFMSKAFEAFPENCLRVLDTHDRFGLRHREFLEAGMRPQWFSTTLAQEEIGFRRAHAVLAIQATEAQNFRERLAKDSTEVLQVGHLIEMVELKSHNDSAKAVFLASENPINVAGANYFISQVLPLVRAEVPEFELVLAGTVSNEIQDTPGVVRLGYVEHLCDAFGAGSIAVNPVLMGTGVNIKLLDALACAMPSVSTESGSRGLDAYRDSALQVVPDGDPRAFADALLKLLADADERQRMRGAARKAAEHWNRQQLIALDRLLDGDVRTGNAARDAA